MLRIFFLVLCTALLGLGCQTNPFARPAQEPGLIEDVSPLDENGSLSSPVVPEPGLQLSTNQRFKDVPLPTGLDEDQERSYVYQSSTLEIGRMVYTTRDTVNALALFYIKECPTADWKLQNSLQANGVNLTFTKAGKRLQVTIQKHRFGKRMLILNLTPETGTL